IAVRPYGMGEGTTIFRELMRAKNAHIENALHCARAHVACELLVAENGKAFLQAKLEPVAAGDAIAGPVVEIFMRDNRLYGGIVGIGRRVGPCKNVFVVEYIEALVLHRAHIEG